MARPLSLQPGEVIAGRWRVLGKIGEGTFSEIYAAEDREEWQLVAVKTERQPGMNIVELEHKVLSSLQHLPNVCRHIYYGMHRDLPVLIMEMLGQNVSQLRRSLPEKRFSLSTAVSVGVKMLECVKHFHRAGFLHRDVKPGNFVCGLGDNSDKLYLLDFGLTRLHLDSSGKPKPPRARADFRGTSVYASLHAHKHMELSRRDDVWSLFYMLVDVIVRPLPWRDIYKDRDAIRAMKQMYWGREDELIGPGVWQEPLVKFAEHLRSLEYEQEPQYTYLQRLLCGILEQSGLPQDLPLDWVQLLPSAGRQPAYMLECASQEEQLARNWWWHDVDPKVLQLAKACDATALRQVALCWASSAKSILQEFQRRGEDPELRRCMRRMMTDAKRLDNDRFFSVFQADVAESIEFQLLVSELESIVVRHGAAEQLLAKRRSRGHRQPAQLTKPRTGLSAAGAMMLERRMP